ncbi:MAG: RbsD/FucU family protein [Gaiellaceae bacterium]
MLRNIDPLLTPELLFVLAAMGHGDELVVADANFPADSVGRQTAHGRAIRLPGASAPVAVRAILSLLPVDELVEEPVRRMAIDGSPDEVPPVQRELQAEVDRALGRSLPLGALERFAFYEASRRAYAVVATGERRFWGNVLVKKGVVPPET